jgi:hypothetical protein
MLRNVFNSGDQLTASVPSAFATLLTLSWVRQNAATEAPDIVIVPGSGTGLDLGTLMNELPRHCRVLWMEVDPVLAAKAFLRWPVEEYVADGRMQMVLGLDEKLAEKRFLETWNLNHSAMFKICDQLNVNPDADRFYNKVLRSICKSVSLDLFNIGTLICRGGLWQMNTLTNLPVLLRNPGVKALFGAFPRKPALVVGAGPSLDAALPHLVACAKGFVIISTGTALRALKKVGIRPDIVVAVDGHPLTASQFETPCGDLYLACSTLAFPPGLRKFKGLFSGTLDANPIDKWFDEVTEQHGQLLAAGTVTSSGVDLAVQMGCDPVVTIGFDLSLAEDGTTHASNTMYHGVRVAPDEQKLVRLPGNYRETVATTRQFQLYATLLERYVEGHPYVQFVNVTDAGIRIKGMSLVRAARLGEFSTLPFDAAGIVARIHRGASRDYGAEVTTELTNHLKRLNSVADTARRAAAICNRLMIMPGSRDPDSVETMKRLMVELDEKDMALQEMKACSFLLEMSLRPACFWMATRKTEDEQSYSETVFTYKRWRQFYEQIAGAAMWTRDVVEQALDGIKPREPDTECDGEVMRTDMILQAV